MLDEKLTLCHLNANKEYALIHLLCSIPVMGAISLIPCPHLQNDIVTHVRFNYTF